MPRMSPQSRENCQNYSGLRQDARNCKSYQPAADAMGRKEWITCLLNGNSCCREQSDEKARQFTPGAFSSEVFLLARITSQSDVGISCAGVSLPKSRVGDMSDCDVRTQTDTISVPNYPPTVEGSLHFQNVCCAAENPQVQVGDPRADCLRGTDRCLVSYKRTSCRLLQIRYDAADHLIPATNRVGSASTDRLALMVVDGRTVICVVLAFLWFKSVLLGNRGTFKTRRKTKPRVKLKSKGRMSTVGGRLMFESAQPYASPPPYSSSPS